MRALYVRRFALALLAVSAVVLCLEIGLRTRDRLQGHRFWDTHGNVLREPFRQVKPFRTFGFDPYVDKDGATWISDRWDRRFAMNKPAGTFRVVCFGGSTTANRVEERHYPGLLQEQLRRRAGNERIEVINAGNSAYATPHSIILLSLDVVSWDADVVIISHNVNDLSVLFFPGFRPDYWNKYARSYYTTPNYAERYTWTHVLFQHSRLYWFVQHRLENLRTGSRYQGPALRRGPHDPARVAEAEDVFRRNLATFVSIATAHGVPVILGTQPLNPSADAFLDHMAHKPYNDIAVYPPHEEFVAGHAAYNRIIREVANGTGSDLVDMAAAFDGDPAYFVDHVHYTEAGLRRLADGYADAILAGYPVPGGTGGAR